MEATGYRSRLQSCVRYKEDEQQATVQIIENEINNVWQKVDYIVGGFTTSVVILYILVGMLIVALLMVYKKKSKVAPSTNHMELDEEYLNLTKNNNDKLMADT